MYDYIIMNTHWSVFSLLPLHLTAEIWCSSGDNTSIVKVNIPFLQCEQGMYHKYLNTVRFAALYDCSGLGLAC